MNCLRYWARYVRKGEVKSGGIKNGNESAPWILLLDSPLTPTTSELLDLINQDKLGSNFVRPIEPINRLIHTQSMLLQFTIHTKKNREIIGKEGCSF